MENSQSKRNKSVPRAFGAPPATGQQGQSLTTSFNPVNTLPHPPDTGSFFQFFTNEPSVPGPSNRGVTSNPFDLFTQAEIELIAQAVRDQERNEALNNGNGKQ